MSEFTHLSDADLLTRMPALVLAERGATADVLEHLVEIDRRRLYLEQACGSLQAYCIERLGFSEDAAFKACASCEPRIQCLECSMSCAAVRFT